MKTSEILFAFLAAVVVLGVCIGGYAFIENLLIFGFDFTPVNSFLFVYFWANIVAGLWFAYYLNEPEK